LTPERTRLLLAVMIGVMAIAASVVLAVILTRSRGPQAVAQASPQPPPPTAATTSIAPVEAPTTELILAPSPTPADSPAEAVPTVPASPTAVPTEPDAEAPSATLTPTVTDPQNLPPLAGPQELAGAGSSSTAPVNLAQGLYRLYIETDGDFGAVGPVVDEGDCGEIPFFTNASGPFEGGATYRSTGCLVHFEVSETSGGWSITVEPAAEGGLLAVPAAFSGDAPSASGLVDLPEGDYHLTLVTESTYSMVVPIVASGDCLERPVFLLTEPGTHQTTYRSTGCLIVFQIDNVSAAWELAIVPEG